MKTLQNNFTTPEQSKRLLELGVPEDSADCFFASLEQGELSQPHMLYGSLYSKRVPYGYEKFYLPCWSVGRLIEIHTACAGASSSYYISAFPTNILNEVMWHLIEAVRHGWVDFSKLEE